MARVVILTGSPHYDGASQKLADNFEKGIKLYFILNFYAL